MTSAGCSKPGRRTPSRAVSSRSAMSWTAPPPAAPSSTSISKARIHPDADLGVAADRDALVHAVTTFALTVAREHGTGVLCDVTREGPGRAHAFALLSFVPRGRNFRTDAKRVQFHHLRPGQGLRLVVAVEQVRRIGGTVHDLVSGDRPAGVELRLPLA